MKKKLFLAMLISACFAGAFLASCDDDDEDGVACTCINWSDGEKKTIINSGKYGVSNCDALMDKLDEASGDDYECWDPNED